MSTSATTASWNRLVRFLPTTSSSTPLIGEPVDPKVDVGLAVFEGKEVEVEVYEGSSVLSAGGKTGRKEKVAMLLSPVAENEVGTIRCIGLNYKLHAKETNLDLPTVPILFLKPSTSLAGPYPEEIVVPKFTVAHESADYESELGVILSKDAKDVTEEEAMDYVLGYTATNDVSSRKSQFEQSQWCFSKGFDKACPVGPVLVSPRAIPDPTKLTMKGLKNGKVMQTTGLDDLVFSIPKLISFLSQGTTLKAGTLILTGTPHGIGFFYKPPEILRDGDDFRVEIDGGIGTLINKVRPSLKVALIGAAGGIGQPLALLLKQSPSITELALYDVVPVVKGVAADISHVDTPSVVTGYDKENDGLKLTLTGADIVVIPAGVPRKPGMTRDDLFNINAGIVRDLATAIAEYCPKAFVCVISNPVNSTVPITAEVLKAAGVFDPKRLFGVTTLDVVRASTMSAQAVSDPSLAAKLTIPVIGGHAGTTILPLLSQAKPALPASLFDDKEKLEALVKRIQFGGDEVVAAKAGAGSATLSMAYAGYKFVDRLIAGAFEGKSGVVEPSYVYVKGNSDITKEIGDELDFFSVPVELGPSGAEKLLPLGSLSSYEAGLLKAALPELSASIAKGVSFAGPKL